MTICNEPEIAKEIRTLLNQRPGIAGHRPGIAGPGSKAVVVLTTTPFPSSLIATAYILKMFFVLVYKIRKLKKSLMSF
jgi:hypothetical protein